MTTTPDITLEMLQADRREALAHLAVWPDDKFGLIRLNNIEGAISEILSKPEVPMMGHMRPRADLNAKPKAPRPVSFGDAIEQLEKKAKDVIDEWKFGQIQYKGEGDGATRYTFGADYEMDQLWLAAERKKVSHMGMGDWPSNDAITSPAEPDRYAFPTMAYNLTSLRNLNYGTSRY